MIHIHSHIVKEIDQSVRFVDYAIGIFPQVMTKNAVKKAIKRGELLLNSSLASTGNWVKVNDVIDLVDPQNRIPKEYPLSIEIVFEDEYLLIVNKPSGIVVSGNHFRTLENALVNSITVSAQPDAFKWAKPAHRIDSATSGLVLFAKTSKAHRDLSSMFKNKLIYKKYQAIVQGKPKGFVAINESIEGKESLSELKLIKSVNSLQNDKVSLVELSPKTGRTHQLRIHCSSIGHPIVGDKLYGEAGNVLKHKGLFLTAMELRFNHPITNQEIITKIDTPSKFTSLLSREERRWMKYNKSI